MAFSISNSMKQFWHAMTSNDRHANFDSPWASRDSGHGVGRNPPLSSVHSDGYGQGIYNDEPAARSTTALAAPGGLYSPGPRSASSIGSAASPYSPGMRGQTAGTAKPDRSDGGAIPMQEFSAEGLPPPPPVSHSWARIDRWAENNYPELFDQLCEPATVNDLNELEHELDCSLPMEVRESLMIHDGQERGGTPTGIILGLMLLDCEEMLDEWNNWRTVNKEFLSQQPLRVATGASSSSSAGNGASAGIASLKSRQDSHPDGAIQKVYVHPGWIPMARDWGGNNIAVDLAPGPNGKWGQVIIFGRDYDCKYVIARSWAAFLAMVADDLESPHWYVEEDSGELKLRDPRAPRYEPTYIEICRVRCERKYGRKIRRRPGSSGPSSPASQGNPKSADFLSPSTAAQKKPSRSKESTLAHPKPKPLPSVLEDITETKAESGAAGASSNGTADLLDTTSDANIKPSLSATLKEVSLTDDAEPAAAAPKTTPLAPTVEAVPEESVTKPEVAAAKRASVEA